MIWTWVLLIVGFALLLKGADWLVDGSSSIAKRLKISNIVIGLTIVAFGTSLPELLVNIFAAVGGSTELALGNVVGSNMANMLLVLGVAAVITPLTVHKGTTLREIPFNLLAAVAVAVLANDMILDGDGVSILTRADGITLLLFFMIFVYYSFASGRVQDQDVESQKAYDYIALGRSFLAIIVGAVALFIGGKLVVDNAITIAADFGISEGLIALTVVAIGTSLPELVTSAIAAKKKNVGIAVGNVVGSNIFNLLWILGATALIEPIALNGLNEDILIMTAVTILLFFSMFWGKRHVLQRWQGWILLALYATYMIYIILRG